jgi:hypothetical protein
MTMADNTVFVDYIVVGYPSVFTWYLAKLSALPDAVALWWIAMFFIAEKDRLLYRFVE